MYTLNVRLINGNTSTFDFFTVDEANEYFYQRRMLENPCITGVYITNDKTFSEWLKEKHV
jgi:hypothetical protein